MNKKITLTPEEIEAITMLLEMDMNSLIDLGHDEPAPDFEMYTYFEMIKALKERLLS